jgi:D-alanyl-D-alanine carboxypeptidase (penicillin-binding protein 5/6)
MRSATLSSLLIVMFVIMTAPYSVETAYAEHQGIPTYAQASALIDVESGRILMQHHGDEKMLIASLTKVMTAIVAIEYGDLSDQVIVGKNAYAKEGSSIYLHLGEKMNLEHMLYGLMLRSGNDAATAIAEHVGGSLEGFAYLMNEKARSIGMTNSNFVNPHGLNAKDHYSTANDMALLTAYALRHPTFKEIVKTKVKKVPNPHEKWDYTWYNKNKMLSMYENGDGVKTGYTKLAGRCLISSATKDGQQLAVVTLNDPNDWADHTRWLNFGFENYALHTIVDKEAPIEGHSLVAGKSFVYPLSTEEVSAVSMKVQLLNPETAHYRLGERGTMKFYLHDKPIGSIPVFDAGSHRLNLNNQPTFMFQESQYNGNSESNYVTVFKTVFRSLFAW